MDGRGVARLAALDSPEGAAHVAADLNRALAQATLEQKSTGELDLSVSIDREVDGGAIVRLLRIARGAGVRRIELLLTRGESPELERGGPRRSTPSSLVTSRRSRPSSPTPGSSSRRPALREHHALAGGAGARGPRADRAPR